MNPHAYQPAVHRLAATTACVALLPIVIGALVTSLGAGMAFLDWPTSGGRNMLLYPWLSDIAAGRTDKVAEHGHRLAGIVIGSPFASGVLATGAVEGALYNYVPAPPEILEKVGRIEAVCRRHHVPLAAAALQFPLGHPSVAAVIPGAVKPDEVLGSIEMMGTDIPAALWDELKAEGLLRAEAPVP